MCRARIDPADQQEWVAPWGYGMSILTEFLEDCRDKFRRKMKSALREALERRPCRIAAQYTELPAPDRGGDFRLTRAAESGVHLCSNRRRRGS